MKGLGVLAKNFEDMLIYSENPEDQQVYFLMLMCFIRSLKICCERATIVSSIVC